MATFKALIKPNERKQDGTWNVKIRVYHNKETRYIATPFWVTQEQLTRSLKIKDSAILDKVEQEIKRYRDSIVNIGFIADGLSVDHLIRLVNNDSNKIDFIKFMEDYVAELQKKGRGGTAKVYARSCLSLKKYNKDKPLYFSNITSYFMLDYFKHISKRLKDNSIRSYIISIKTMYRLAEKRYNDEEMGVMIVKRDVFKLIDLPPLEDSDRISLTIEQMQKMIDVPYTGKWYHDFIKDMFILSFVCLGTNPKDLFFMKKENIVGDILTYRRSKISNRSGKDSEMQIKLSEVAKIIIAKYSKNKKYLIDFRGRARDIIQCNYIHEVFKSAGLEDFKSLKESNSDKYKYCFYTARHTMATLARNECGVDYMTVHQMLNHATPQSLRTTDVYIQKDFSPLWEANEKLLDLFDWSFYLNQKEL